MYHQISPAGSSSSLRISPNDFLRQIHWLEKRSFRFLSLDQVVDLECRVPFLERAVSLTFDDGFRDNYEQAFPILLEKKINAALFVVVNWVGQNGFMDWKEIRELADSGITIGSHSLTHRWLPNLSNPSELQVEIRDSKRKIEDQIGKEVRHFCYPVGGLSEPVAGEVKRAGYKAGWVASATPTVRIDDPLFCVRRVKISSSDSNLFRFAIKTFGIKRLFQPV